MKRARNEGVRFLATLFSGRSKAPVFLTSLANDRADTRRIPPRSIVTRDPDRVAAFAATWDKAERALYFCVATLKPGIMRRAKENLAEIICLHADLDFKGIEASRKEIEAALKRLPMRPQIVVFSGHGLHCYWLLHRALPADDDNIARVERLLKRLADVLAGDPAVCEASRVMRLPGSHNSKRGEWIPVKTIASRKGSYTIDRLERWLKAAKPVLRRKAKDGARAPVRFGDNGAGYDPWAALGQEQFVRAPIDVDERLGEMQYEGPDESGIHNSQLSVTAALLRRGYPVDTVVERVLEATVVAAGPAGRFWDWREEERTLRAMCAAWLKKCPQVVFVED